MRRCRRNHALRSALKTPRDNLFVNGQLDYALTLDQTLRFGYNLSRFSSDNLGVGGYDEPERAFSTSNSAQPARPALRTAGPPRLLRSRLQVFWSDTDAQLRDGSGDDSRPRRFHERRRAACGRRSLPTLDLGSDLDYVLGRHSFRDRCVLDGGWYRSDTTSNYLGTYTFDNLEAYAPTSPVTIPGASATRGSLPNLQAGLYVQDDIRLRRT